MRQKEIHEYLSDGETCPTCCRTFATRHGLASHHGQVHDESIAGVLVVCDTCGETFRRCESHVEEQDHHFCSNPCMGEWKEGAQTGEDNPFWGGGPVEKECEWCGSDYTVVPAEADGSRFCSHDCRGEWQSENWVGEDHPTWSRVELSCDTCGETIHRKQSHVSDHNFCSPQCKGDWLAETNYAQSHHQWRGGKDVYHAVKHSIGTESWNTSRRQARSRADGCEMCGEHPDRKLDVHHIVPIMSGGCNADELLMCLCRTCHRKVELLTRKITDPVLIE